MRGFWPLLDMSVKPITYLDHNASAPLLPEARAALVETLDLTGNPSSVHAAGRALKNRLDTARGQVAKLAGAERGQVVFTGSATEAIAQAIVGGVKTLKIDRVVVCAGEHASVLKAAETSGAEVTTIPLTADGVIDVDAMRAAIEDANEAGESVLVAVQTVNSETGVVQPLEAVKTLVGPTPHFLFVDAVQAFGRLDLGFAASPVDMMAVSAHKIGGPAGIGALLMKSHCDTVRLIEGGGQELGRRGGTEAVALAAGFGAAAEAYPASYAKAGVADLVATLEGEVLRLAPDAVIFGKDAERLGNVSCFAVPGLKAEVALMSLDLEGIAISSGSACSSGKVGRSKVLTAMGMAPELADCALRVSLGWSSTKDDLDRFLGSFEKLLKRSRKPQAA